MAGVGFADEAEKLLPTAWDDEAHELGMGPQDLVLMNGALWMIMLRMLPFMMKHFWGPGQVLTGGTLAKSPGLKVRA